MMTKTIMIGAALLTAAAAAGAHPPAGHDPMRMLDSDGSGGVSLAEMRRHAAAMFAKLDVDGDGRATAEELRAHHGKMGAHHGPAPGAERGPPPPGDRRGPPPLERLDTDRDGVVSLAEFTAMIERHFAEADVDRDGNVTREELQAAHRGRPGRR